jgi:ATP-binding cassette, subfamily B, bacterial CvaB/MchF/RaxB
LYGGIRFSARPVLPVILQSEAAECGLACIAMVASYHGYHADLAAIRRGYALSLKGATLANLIHAAGSLELSGRPLRLELDDIVRLRTPCILHWDLNHFVVLRRACGKRIVIHDPALGVRDVSYAEASRHFTGIALELAPTPNFSVKRAEPPIPLRSLMGKVIGLRSSLAQILLLAIALEMFAIVSPLYLQWVVDNVVVSEDRQLLTTLGIGFALLMLVQVLVGAVRSWAVLYMSSTLSVQWLANLFSHLLHLPLAYFERRHLGDVVSRFNSASVIQHTLSTSFVEAIIDGLMTTATIAMMLAYSPKLTLIAALAVACYALLRNGLYDPLRTATSEQIVQNARQQSHFLETVRGIQSIKLFGRQNERASRWMNLLVESTNREIRTSAMAISFRAANAFVFGAERIAVIWIGALLVLDNSLSVGMLFAFVAFKDQFSQRAGSLIDKWVELRMLRLHGERLADIVMTPPEPDRAAPLDLECIAPSIEVRNVSFRYAEAEPFVLRACSFTVKPGESIAIIGASGCGKTTLVKVMLGLLEPTDGKILVDGVDIRKLGLGPYRKLVGTVMQDDQLFAGSIADNISFFDPQCDQHAIVRCAQVASIDEEIDSMPMGYNTLIGDMGTTLSGGQKQRLLLARALYKDPKVLFLDEATSHLDLRREMEVNAAVQKLKVAKVVIAHRPETIRAASRVITMRGGTVVEDDPAQMPAMAARHAASA